MARTNTVAWSDHHHRHGGGVQLSSIQHFRIGLTPTGACNGFRCSAISCFSTRWRKADSGRVVAVRAAAFLQEKSNLHFEVKVPPSYIAVVEAFGSNRADIAVMNTFGYILAHEKYGAEAHLMGVHFGQKSYQGQIIAKKGKFKK